MVQLYYSKGDPWDAYADIFAHNVNARNSDQTFAAVIEDLKARGLGTTPSLFAAPSSAVRRFATLAEWRTKPSAVGSQSLRLYDVARRWCFKGGPIYRVTDDFGFKAIEKPVHVHGFHATILDLLGIDHTKLAYRYSGRDFQLRDVAGNVIHDVIA